MRPDTHGQPQSSRHLHFGNRETPGTATKIIRRCLFYGMRRLIKLPASLWIALILSLGAGALVADTSGNPYLGIAGSNSFRLKPPQRQDADPPVVPFPRVKLVGITTFGKTRALLKVYLPARPPEPARELSCILTVGQREGPIEVLEVDELVGRVTVKNSGTVMLLTLENEKPGPQSPAMPPEPPPLPMRAASRQ